MTMTDQQQHCVVVGGSHAAAQFVANLRQRGFAGRITLVSEEALLPYQRPPLSKGFLGGTLSEAELLIRPEAFYREQRIETRLGERATRIDRAAHKIQLQSGGELEYTKLVLATGARVRKLQVPGADLNGVYYLRSFSDVQAIRDHAKAGQRAVVVGGGYIGLEAAASLRKLGLEVTLLEAMPRLLQRVTAPVVSALYARVHDEEGVKVQTGTVVRSFEGSDQVQAVVTEDGQHLLADLVIVGVGVIPATELAQEAGLEVRDGIVVNEFAVTSDPDILAIGDCTSHYNALYERWLRLESVQNASDQARTAAATVSGVNEPYNALPWFWSDQYDLKLQIAGLSQGFDRVVTRGDIESGRSFSAFYFSGDRLIAVDAVNRPKEFMVSKRFLTERRSADPARVADESVELKDCFA